jgi:hypothetical protein
MQEHNHVSPAQFFHRYRGVMSALVMGRYGNSAWGQQLNACRMAAKRWKHRDRYEATFPFRTKVPPQAVDNGLITPSYVNSPPPTGSGPTKAQKYVSRYKGPKTP